MRRLSLTRILAMLLVVCIAAGQLPMTFAETAVEELSVSGLAMPEPGMTPDYTAVADGVGYSVFPVNEGDYRNGVAWYDISLGRFLAPEETFISGHAYASYVVVQPEYGYSLLPIVCKVDGMTAEAWPQGDNVALFCSYGYCGAQTIDYVSVIDLETPVIGAAPTYTASLGTKGYSLAAADNNYSQNGIVWYDNTQEHNLATSGKFADDHVYTVYVTVKANAGYQFATFSDMSATINGYKAEIFGGMSQDELVVALEFTPCKSAEDRLISEVTIFNVITPEEGKNPSYIANVMPLHCELMDLDGENTLHGISWYDETAGREMEITDCFIGGHTYTMIIYIQALPGYIFDPQAEFLINGELAFGYGTDGFATVTQSFTCEGNGFTDVDPNAFYYQPMIWAVQEHITTGTSSTTFSPNAACTRAQAVTFIWRSLGSPPPAQIGCPFLDVSDTGFYYEAMMWALGSNITKGTSDTEFSPDLPCTRAQIVTFLWRASGCPEIQTENIFSDVSANAYYYHAVLWAVERGITKGTEEGIFSPDEHCTRGQIVTFLWRTVHP